MCCQVSERTPEETPAGWCLLDFEAAFTIDEAFNLVTLTRHPFFLLLPVVLVVLTWLDCDVWCGQGKYAELGRIRKQAAAKSRGGAGTAAAQPAAADTAASPATAS